MWVCSIWDFQGFRGSVVQLLTRVFEDMGSLQCYHDKGPFRAMLQKGFRVLGLGLFNRGVVEVSRRKGLNVQGC